MAEEKNIYNLKLHEEMHFENGRFVMRVPGGWIYKFYNANTIAFPDSKKIQTHTHKIDSHYENVFVPYNDEFKNQAGLLEAMEAD